jgi:hypothetical protein
MAAPKIMQISSTQAGQNNMQLVLFGLGDDGVVYRMITAASHLDPNVPTDVWAALPPLPDSAETDVPAS